MGKNRDKDRHVLSKLFIYTGLTTGIVLLFISLISKQQEERKKTLEREQELAVEVQKLEKKNSDLRKKHSSLLTDTVQVERYAREELNYLAPGEKVFDIIPYKIKPNESEKRDEEPKINGLMWEGSISWQLPALIILVSFVVFAITFLLENRNKENG